MDPPLVEGGWELLATGAPPPRQRGGRPTKKKEKFAFFFCKRSIDKELSIDQSFTPTFTTMVTPDADPPLGIAVNL